MTVHETLIVETFLLSRVNLEQWNRHLTALGTYTQELIEKAILNSTPEAIGMAKQALLHLRDMRDIEATYKKIKAAQDKKP